jgi:hypothetical protein
MKLKVLTSILLASAVVIYSQEPDKKFLEKVMGLQEIGRIAQEGAEFRRPQVSPDGRWVAFTTDSRLWVAKLGDLKPTLLGKSESGSHLRQYSWSPDSQQIAYVDGRTVRLINVMTREVTAYTTVSPFMSDPVFDGEGNLAIVGNTDLIGNAAAAEGDVEKVKLMTPKDRPYLKIVSKDGKDFTLTEEQLQLGEYNIIAPYIFRPRAEAYLNIQGTDTKITPSIIAGASRPNCMDVVLSPDRRKVIIHCTQTSSYLSVYEISTEKRYDLSVIAKPGSWSPNSEWVLYLDEISEGHGMPVRMDLYLTHYTGGQRVKLGSAKGIGLGVSWGRNNIVAYDEGEGEIVINKILFK